MKNALYLILLKIIFCSTILSQSKEDFKVYTYLTDTIFFGYQNELMIDTKWDKSKLSLSGKNISIMFDEVKQNYFVIPVYRTNISYEITLSYTTTDDSIKKFIYQLHPVFSTPKLINRLRESKNLSPLNLEFSNIEINPNSAKGVKLTIPSVIPERYDPILISQNKKFAFFGNSNNQIGTVVNLNSKKIEFVDDHDSILHYSENDVISNTGRYLYCNTYNDEFTILFKDFSVQKYYSMKNDIMDELYGFRFLQFSPNDITYLFLSFSEENIPTLSVSRINDVKFTKFHFSGNEFVNANYVSNESVLVLSKKEIENSTNYRFYIDSININDGSSHKIDSLIIQIEPFDIIMEHGILVFGIKEHKNKIKYLVYNAQNCKLISEFQISNDHIQQFNDVKIKSPYYHTSINPEGTHFSLFDKLNNYSIYLTHNILQSKTTINKQRKSKKFTLYQPILLANNVLFGKVYSKNTYIDFQREFPYWYDYKNSTSTYFNPPINQYGNYEWGYTGEILEYGANINSDSIYLESIKFKRGKEKIVSDERKSYPLLGKSTFRFGTKINFGSGNLDIGIYDFNLSNLQLNKLESFNYKAHNFRSNLFINSLDFNYNSFVDSLALLDMNRQVSLIHMQDSTKLIYTDNENGGYLFYNSSKDKKIDKIVYFKLFKTDEWVLYSDDKYYACYFKSEPIFQFYLDGKSHPFEQFDLKYNRPDIILDRLGYADSSLAKAYHQAYLKRLKKMNFTEDMLKDDFHLPELKIENFEKMPTIIEGDELDLNLNIKDSKYPLDRINVWINDVAIFGTNGISIRDKNTQEYTTSLKLKLAQGNNKIQVSVLNQAGAESYKETFTVNCKAGKEKPNLYIVSIGVSTFEQSQYNLKFAAKDAEDMAKVYANNKNYGQVFTKSLTNQEVTKVNIEQLREFLKAADRNDEVIVFFAGHGVLDAQLDYYLASYDMDFSNPAAKGIAYESLERLLDGIAPLKKILLIDACHSGEIDKEEVAITTTTEVEEGDVKFRNVGNSIANKDNHLGLQNTSELTKSLFADLRKGTGATVISSAGGMEFAMESSQWQNGLFTYCFINGLQSKDADLNKDGVIMLSELQQYVANQVTQLSNGKQQPTSRIENNVLDWRVW